MTKRKNDIAHMNYKIIQENEKFIKEQKIKTRELANIENAELFKKQVNPIFQMRCCLLVGRVIFAYIITHCYQYFDGILSRYGY